MKRNKRGISLIVLVITIIVMIILAAAIILALNGNNVVSRANQAKASSDLATFKEAYMVKKSESNLYLTTMIWLTKQQQESLKQ